MLGRRADRTSGQRFAGCSEERGTRKGDSFVNGRSVDGTGQTRSGVVRRGLIVTAVVACTSVVLAGAPLAAAPKESPRKSPTGRAFYVPPNPLPEAAPGKLIWSAPFKAIAGAQAWKILYHSRALDGSDVAVSGVVVAP